MTKPFLTDESVGKQYTTRDGETVTVVHKLSNGMFLVASATTGWRVYPDGKRFHTISGEDFEDIIAPVNESRKKAWLHIMEIGGKPLLTGFRVGSEKPDWATDKHEVTIKRKSGGEWFIISKTEEK